jgi:hypothetical protein
MKFFNKSPYVKNPDRLGDVIAAIQAMGIYEFHMCKFERWAKNITGDSSKGNYWKKIFEEHPEFFRLDSTREMASLVWRRQYPKCYHVDLKKEITLQELNALPADEEQRISRRPISDADIKTLIDAAINLHSRAIELQREGRWWIPLASSLIGGLIGAILGTIFHK